jgi:hypothetical protein
MGSIFLLTTKAPSTLKLTGTYAKLFGARSLGADIKQFGAVAIGSDGRLPLIKTTCM